MKLHTYHSASLQFYESVLGLWRQSHETKRDVSRSPLGRTRRSTAGRPAKLDDGDNGSTRHTAYAQPYENGDHFGVPTAGMWFFYDRQHVLMMCDTSNYVVQWDEGGDSRIKLGTPTGKGSTELALV